MKLKLHSKIVISIILLLILLRMIFPIRYGRYISYDNLYHIITLLILGAGIVFLNETGTIKQKINYKKITKYGVYIYTLGINTYIIILSIKGEFSNLNDFLITIFISNSIIWLPYLFIKSVIAGIKRKNNLKDKK